MSAHTRRNVRGLHVGVIAGLLVYSGCGPADSTDSVVESASRAAAAVEAQLLRTDPCAWLPRAQVEAILGTFVSDPVRVESAERAEPAPNGRACLYQPSPKSGNAYALALEVIVDGALELETGLGASLPRLSDGLTANTSPGRAEQENEWDWSGGVSGIYAARRGHIAVMIGDQAPWLGRARLDSLASLLLDSIADLPMAASDEDLRIAGAGRDPCALLTRGEVDELLGVPNVRMYRSKEDSPLVHGNGPSCALYLGAHRVLVLTPTWSDAGMVFRMLSGVTRMAASGLSNESATDTLDGPWDAISTGVNGTLYVLKGERMLALQHGQSRLDAVTTLKIARVAAGRL